MVDFIIIAVLVLLVFLFFQFKNMQHKTYAVIIIAFLLFFYISGSKIIAENNVDVTSFNGMVTAGKLYASWLGHVLKNTKNLVGEVIKMDWAG